MKEYEWVIQNIKEDGLIALDNTYKISEEHEDPIVNGLLQVLERIGEVNIINLPFVSWYTPGLAIIQKTPNLSQTWLETGLNRLLSFKYCSSEFLCKLKGRDLKRVIIIFCHLRFTYKSCISLALVINFAKRSSIAVGHKRSWFMTTFSDYCNCLLNPHIRVPLL